MTTPGDSRVPRVTDGLVRAVRAVRAVRVDGLRLYRWGLLWRSR